MFRVFVAAVLFSVVFAEYRSELNLIGDEKIGQVIKTQIKHLKKSEMPTNFDYRSLGLLTSDLNQHIPTYWCVSYLSCFSPLTL